MAYSKPKKGNGRRPFMQVDTSVVKTPAWSLLNFSSRALYFELRSAFNGRNNGNLAATFTVARRFGWGGQQTLTTALYELMALGFLKRTRAGGIARGSTFCCLYAFTDLPIDKNDQLGISGGMATRDFERYRTVADAKKALSGGLERLRSESGGRAYSPKGKGRKLMRQASEIDHGDASVCEQDGSRTMQILVPNQKHHSARNPMRIRMLRLVQDDKWSRRRYFRNWLPL